MGGEEDDILSGEDGDNILYGVIGNDVMRGGLGANELYVEMELTPFWIISHPKVM